MNTAKLRSWAWHRLVYLADRISPENAFRATGLHIHLKKGVGWVLNTSGDRKGIPVWYRGSQTYDDHAYDGYDESPVVSVTEGMSNEEIERLCKSALYWNMVKP